MMRDYCATDRSHDTSAIRCVHASLPFNLIRRVVIVQLKQAVNLSHLQLASSPIRLRKFDIYWTPPCHQARGLLDLLFLAPFLCDRSPALRSQLNNNAGPSSIDQFC